MEVILEGILEWLAERVMRSKRLRPGMKTVLIFLGANLITALILWGAVITWQEQRSIIGSVLLCFFAAAWFGLAFCLCVMGHKCGWELPDR